jgi:Transglycosylase SLT domain
LTVQVPSQFVPLINQMASATGLPYNVIAAQANEESGFNTQAVSPTGAEGWLQFEPSTYASYTTAAGVANGTEFNASDESKVYDVFMSDLLKEFNGNVSDALAAYNAGPGNLQAGAGYASTILSNAGEGSSIVASPNASQNPTATLTSFNPLNPSSWLPAIFSGLGITTDIEDILERGALMLFGGILIVIGIVRMSNSSGSNPKNQPSTQQSDTSSDDNSGSEESSESTDEATQLGNNARQRSREHAARNGGTAEEIEMAAAA